MSYRYCFNFGRYIYSDFEEKSFVRHLVEKRIKGRGNDGLADNGVEVIRREDLQESNYERGDCECVRRSAIMMKNVKHVVVSCAVTPCSVVGRYRGI